MEERLREKIALVVFIVLVVLAGVVLIGYFSTGRTWSVAATMVDDSVGQMEGYTAIVYSGVEQKKPSDTGGVSGNRDTKQENANQESPTQQKSSSSALSSGEEEVGLTSTSKRVTVAEMISLNFLSIAPLVNKQEQEGVFASDVRDSYEIKGASAITIDLRTPERYSVPTVLQAGNKRIGVFSIESYASKAHLRSVMTYFQEKHTDCVICICPRTALLANDEDIDVIFVLAPEEEAKTHNSGQDSSLVVSVPQTGEVGILLLSANNIPSTRTITTLQ